MTDTAPPLHTCFLCEKGFQFGPRRYDGRAIPVWDIGVCDLCFKGNHDGLVPDQHPRLVSRLRERGIPLTKNARGWLAWPPGT